MRVLLQHIVVLLATVVMSVSCSRDRGEVIPRSKMARIYAEMLMTDQWVNSRPEIRRIADTSLVYEPILQKYGYDYLDYLRTVDEYMNDPERFSRIFRASGEIIEERLKELRMELDRRNKLEALRKRIEQMTVKSDFQAKEFFPYMFDEPYVRYYDSLVVEIDSVIRHYRFRDVPTTDTLYEGVRMVLQLDSLPSADSLAIKDSLLLDGFIELRDNNKKADGISKALRTDMVKSPMKVEGGLKRRAVRVTEDEILFD